MNIIFGRENAALMSERYTVLELDTIKFSNGNEITAYCAVETIPIINMPRVESMKNLHTNLIENYRTRNWNYCEQALEHLKGFWNSEVDTFYDSIDSRIKQEQANPTDEWDWRITR